jgi:hypothetical protein
MEELMSLTERKPRTSPRINMIAVFQAMLNSVQDGNTDPAVSSVLGVLSAELDEMKEKIENGEDTSEDSGEPKPRGRKPALNDDGTRVHPVKGKGPHYVVYSAEGYDIVQTDKAPTSENLGECEHAWGPFPRRTSAEKASENLDACAEKKLF